MLYISPLLPNRANSYHGMDNKKMTADVQSSQSKDKRDAMANQGYSLVAKAPWS